ncbi:MAG: hypothetical protein C4315_05435 [Chloroflexota bacterium]
MVAVLAEALNWLLALFMWAIIGRLVLELITGGHRSIFSEFLRRLTDPLFWVVRQAMPRFVGDRFIPVLTLLLVIVLRLLLLPLLGVRG